MVLMITIFSALITSMLIYGIIKRRPSYLMPYFSVKVFQVVMASLTTLGFYSCLPNVRVWIQSHEYFPFKSTILLLDNQTLELFVFSILLTSILAKLYAAIIVWYCYRYMITIESFANMGIGGGGGGSCGGQNSSVANNGIVFSDEFDSNLCKVGDDELGMGRGGNGGPPKYEDVVVTSAASKAAVRNNLPSTSSASETEAQSDSELSNSNIPSYSTAVAAKNYPKIGI
jgi:hypothetical protein